MSSLAVPAVPTVPAVSTVWERIEALCAAACGELAKYDDDPEYGWTFDCDTRKMVLDISREVVVRKYICDIEAVVGNLKPRFQIRWMESIWTIHRPDDCVHTAATTYNFVEEALWYTANHSS
jgi:hypothetical protein